MIQLRGTSRLIAAGISALALLSMHLTAAASPSQPHVPGRVLLRFSGSLTPARQIGFLKALGARSAHAIPGADVTVVDLQPGADEMAAAAALSQRAEVESVDFDEAYEPQDLTPNDPWYANWEPHLRQIKCPTAWSTTTGSPSVIVAILDSGVEGTHQDLAPKLVAGWNFYDNNSNTADVYGHGTSVAGTAGACTNNGIGVAAPAWNCKLMPLRVTDTAGTGYTSTIASALTWAADHGARVANISFKLVRSSTLDAAAQYFVAKGGVITTSAGNDGLFTSTPLNPYMLTVGAVDATDLLYSWSNTGTNIDLVAPGAVNRTTIRQNSYGSFAGTSASAPLVAGVAALVISANPALTGQQVHDILRTSADDLGLLGWDTTYGCGRLNAARAVALALTTGSAADTTPPTVSITSPANLATVSGSIQVVASATDNVGVTSVKLLVDGVQTSSLTAAPWSFPLNTTALTNGSHTIKATASDAAGNTASAQITVTVSNTTASGTTARINGGGSALSCTAGQFLADCDFSGGFSSSYSTRNILNTTDGALYLTVHAGTSFGYSVPVSNGSYTVKLHFAECYASGAGQRVFNVSLNGSTVLAKFDIFAAAGQNNAVVKSFPVSVTNGTISVSFQSSVGNAIVAAIEVVPGP
jgi:thermitase